MSMMQAVRSVFRHYACFRGRARRSEYWKFILFNTLVVTAGYILAFVFAGSSGGESKGFTVIMGLLGIYMLALILPTLALMVRRLHDIGHTGWLLLIAVTGIGGIVLLIWSIREGDPGENQYGPDPKAKGASAVRPSAPAAATYSAPVTPVRAPEPAPVPEDKVCPNCGAVLAPSAKFCTSCGASLSGESAPSAPSAPASSGPRVTISMGHGAPEKKPVEMKPVEKKPTDDFWQTPTDF